MSLAWESVPDAPRCHSEERSDVGIRSPVLSLVKFPKTTPFHLSKTQKTKKHPEKPCTSLTAVL